MSINKNELSENIVELDDTDLEAVAGGMRRSIKVNQNQNVKIGRGSGSNIRVNQNQNVRIR
jgi:hypothetical protein